MKARVAIMGDGESILCFKSVGIDTYSADPNNANTLARKLARDYQIIFVTENIYSEVEDFVKKTDHETYPIIISIPSRQGADGTGIKTLRLLSEKALGVDIIQQKEDR